MTSFQAHGMQGQPYAVPLVVSGCSVRGPNEWRSVRHASFVADLYFAGNPGHETHIRRSA
jgi:hypothetical protein